MKLFPVLIKNLVEQQESKLDTGDPPTSGLLQAAPASGECPPENASSKELSYVLAEIPDVTDPPAQTTSAGGSSSWRFGGRLFSPSLSARILLGGGVMLFLIAALPVFFRSERTSEQPPITAASKGMPSVDSPGGEALKQTGLNPRKSETSSGPVASAQQTKTAPQSKADSKEKGLPESKGSSQAKAEQQKKPGPDATPGQAASPATANLSSQGTPSGQLAAQGSASTQGLPTDRGAKSPSKSGEAMAGQLSSEPQNLGPNLPRKGQLGESQAQLSDTGPPNPPDGIARASAQGVTAAGYSNFRGQDFPRYGYYADSRSPAVYYPTSANYPTSPTHPMVYYPGTDGRWYPVPFPPVRSANADRSYAPEGPPVGGGRQGSFSGSGLQRPGGAFPGQFSSYPEVSRRELPPGGGTTSTTVPPSHQPPEFPMSPKDSIQYPRIRGDGPSPSSPGQQPSGSTLDQFPSGRSTPPGFWNSNQSSAAPRAQQLPSFGRAGGESSFAAQEPGVARLNGTIEKPLIRSAYEGTGSSIY